MQKLSMQELNRLSVEGYKEAEKMPIVLVLDNVRSMHNVGSVFRTADCFAVTAIYLCGITARPPHREIEKTALGATESVDWKYFERTEDAINELKTEAYQIVALEQTNQSVALQDFHLEKLKRYALVFGNEVQGVGDSVLPLVDICVEIPQFGTKHSFNVSISAGIVLWSFFEKQLNA